jgi:hypothetical protein
MRADAPQFVPHFVGTLITNRDDIAVCDLWSARFEVHAARILDGLIEPCSVGGVEVADLMSVYAMPVSGEALKSMTGLTDITSADMDGWSQAIIDGISNYTGDPDREARCRDGTAAIDVVIDVVMVEMLPSARRSPGNDLVSVMVESVMVESGMPLEQARANIKLTILGGQNEPRDAIAGEADAGGVT